MAIIQGETSPVFKSYLRRLHQDDGGEIALDKVDVTNEILLNNTIAAMNAAGAAAGLPTVVTTSDATYNILAGDGTILCNGASNTVNAVLPTAVGVSGKVYNVKAVDITNAVTLTAQGGEFIDGAASYNFLSQYDSLSVQSDGANWWVV